jgi:hypothetical protein
MSSLPTPIPPLAPTETTATLRDITRSYFMSNPSPWRSIAELKKLWGCSVGEARKWCYYWYDHGIAVADVRHRPMLYTGGRGPFTIEKNR